MKKKDNRRSSACNMSGSYCEVGRQRSEVKRGERVVVGGSRYSTGA